MLKLNYFLADIFILSAEKQPIKLSWRKIEWLLKDPVFEEGTWCNPKTDKDVPFESLRWSVFKNYDATKMYNTKK